MYEKLGKRLFDIVISLVLLLLLIPLLLIIGIAIKIDSRGPIFYIQTRIGKGSEKFNIIKFRTMIVDADKIGPQKTDKQDVRITRFGKYLRQWSFDELPQLLNVLFGHMSLVGPRPDVEDNIKDYDDERLIKLNVRPGITGYAQVFGRSSLDTKEKKKLEIQYVNNISFRTDLHLIMLTVLRVVSAKNSF